MRIRLMNPHAESKDPYSLIRTRAASRNSPEGPAAVIFAPTKNAAR